jgi:hypothetical protein
MSEALDKLKEQVAHAAGSLHDYNAFLENPIWKALVADGQEAMDSLQKELLTPAKTMEDALYKNFVTGKIHGALMLSINAETKRAELQDLYNRVEKELKDASK